MIINAPKNKNAIVYILIKYDLFNIVVCTLKNVTHVLYVKKPPLNDNFFYIDKQIIIPNSLLERHGYRKNRIVRKGYE